MCSCVLCRWLAVGSTHDPIMCVLPTERSRSVFPTYIYRKEREREREKVSNQTQTPFLILGCSYISLGCARSLPCLTRWQMGEREREARELLLYMWLAIRPIYVCTGAVDRRQKTFNHRFFSPAGTGLYFILCFCTIKKKKEKKKLLALCGNEASFSGLKSQSIKPIRIECI